MGANPQQSKMTIKPKGNAAGIACDPATLAGNTARFRMVLPRSFADRNTALTALAPDGRLWIVYLSYGPDTDPEDLIIPSRSIDWERARTRNDFVVNVSAFEALRYNESVPELLFKQAGVYQFALINEVDRELLDDGTPFRVIAGCVVHWSPQ